MTRGDLGLITRLERVVDHEATGKLMRKFRIEKGESLRSVAKRMGVSAPFLSDLELGRRHWTEEKVEQFYIAATL